MVATASKDGKPNVVAKGSTKLIDDTTLAFGEVAGETTYKNILDNPQVAIAVVDPSKFAQVRCLGEAEVCPSGDLYDEIAAMLERMGRPKPKAVIKVKILDIH
ncbi:MAG: hypothetical protein DDT30_01427 [Dehalococcoidia bacterium]|nr:hypothetical protein [Bacillota bacterium]